MGGIGASTVLDQVPTMLSGLSRRSLAPRGDCTGQVHTGVVMGSGRKQAAGVVSSGAWCAHLAPGGRLRRWWLAGVGLVAALPSLVWAASGPVFVHDDFWLLDAYGQGDVGASLRALWEGATVAPARPGASLYYALTYAAFGDHPLPHTLVQAAVNAAAAVLVLLAAEKVWREDVALAVGAIYAVLPNRGSTQLWAAVAPNAIAVGLVAGAVVLLTRKRPVLATVALVVALVTYEGVFGVALLVVLWWVARDARDRRARAWPWGAVSIGALLATAALSFLRSPKRQVTSAGLGIDRLVSSQLGAGVFVWAWPAMVGSALILLGVLTVLVVPGDARTRYRTDLVGALVLWAACLLPFVATRWPIGSEGFFDRANVVIGLGTAAVLGVVLAWLVDLVPRPVGIVVAGGLVGLFAVASLTDVSAYRTARDDGAALLAQVLADVAPTDRTVRIVPPPAAEQGVAQYASGGNLTTAVTRARGDHVDFWLIPDVEPLPPPADAVCYDRLARVVRPCTAADGG